LTNCGPALWPTFIARIVRISRHAIYRIPKPRRTPGSPSRPAVDEVEQAIVEVAIEHPTDG